MVAYIREFAVFSLSELTVPLSDSNIPSVPILYHLKLSIVVHDRGIVNMLYMSNSEPITKQVDTRSRSQSVQLKDLLQCHNIETLKTTLHKVIFTYSYEV